MLTFFISISISESFAHRSGCHRWHTCPSDTGSYIYIPKVEKFEDDEKPNYDRCPNGYNKNDEGICEKKVDNNKYENKYGFKDKDYSYDYENDLYSTDNTLSFDETSYPSNDKKEINNNNNDNDNNRRIFPEVSVIENNKCSPISESINLPYTINPKGVILLADFKTCRVSEGQITLNIPDNPNLKLAAMYIDYNGNNHAGTLINPTKIQSMDKNEGLFTIELDKKMKGISPITRESNTLKKINGLALYNAGNKPIQFKSGNIAELIATFIK